MPFDPELKNQDKETLIRMVEEQRSALATYKETLSRIYREFDAKIEELSLIRRVSDALRKAADLKGLTAGLVEVVISELPADFVGLLLTDPEMTCLIPSALYDRGWEQPEIKIEISDKNNIPLDQGVLGRAVANGSILLLPDWDLTDEQPWPGVFPKQAKSLLALPLVARQQIVGAMVLVSLATGAFGQEHTRTLTIICDHAAHALINFRLIDQLGEINERLLASEIKAHQAREYQQSLLDNAADLIIVADASGCISYTNKAALELGFSPREIEGRPLWDLFSQPEKARSWFASSRKQSRELDMLPPYGGERQVSVSLTPISRTGELLVMARDITRQKELERSLLQAEKLASVGILAAGVAHEIGNPLSAISGYAELLAKKQINQAERTEFSKAISEQAERINRIIRDLLDYSRPSPDRKRVLLVNQAIEAVLNMYFTEKRLLSHAMTIKTRLAKDLSGVNMDRDQLQQVVLNLIMNAAQAMDKGGKLSIVSENEGGFVKIRFIDTGPGIKPEHLAHIFDPFFTTKPPGRGTGLGLSICQRIVSQAGGRLTVESQPGKGAVFSLFLPVADQEGN
ncbi:ATP-binding protein [Dethiosulfatarculus sandiegensis]|uniref:histidine kinase n=1 Tax=Dethiosulfatarculus sandiegensis TaxID=1429043 RepID=A0A0D2J8T2_9BACT|nr:ATP-binding protein [Dethiosulfatarculus sandiegensis]KIX14569.1 histidine kinase [Dethiosulfatarculus sandiegensis]